MKADNIPQLTDEQLKALDQLLSQTHKLYGLLDEFGGHPMLTESEKECIDTMFDMANELDNSAYDRLHAAKQRRGIPSEDPVSDHIDIGSDD